MSDGPGREQADNLAAAITHMFGDLTTPRKPQTADELAAVDRAESIAEDRAWEGRWGGTDTDADHAADRWERAHDSRWP